MRSLIGLTLVLLLAGAGQAQDRAAEVKAIRAVLDDQVSAWNEKDLIRFMKGYWESEHLSFYSGNQKTLGWKATLERYQKKYQGEGKEMGKLKFTELHVELLGPDAAVVRGKWEVTTAKETVGGWFTLVFRKFPGGWKITHDHTSK